MAVEKIEIYGVRHAYVEYNNAGTLAFKRVWFTKGCELKVQNAKLEYSGDGQKYAKNYGYQADGTVEADLDDDTIDSILWPIPVTTPLGGDDFAKRYVHGSYAEMQTNFVGLRISLDAGDVDTGAPLVVRYRILKAQFSPDTPPKMQTEAIVGRMLEWSARKAYTDVTGAAVTGVPTTGAFWVKDIVSNTAAFDPVPSDQL